jgi:hypothetical protein
MARASRRRAARKSEAPREHPTSRRFRFGDSWVGRFAVLGSGGALLVGGLGALAFASFHRAGSDQPHPAGSIRTAALPGGCNVRVTIGLKQLLSEPSFAQKAPPQVVLSGVLARTPAASDIVVGVVELTESGKIADLNTFRVCEERMDGSFVATVDGKLRRGALAQAFARDKSKWDSISVSGLPAFKRAGARAPLYLQADDGSVIVASSEAGLARAVEQSRSGATPLEPGETAGLWASITLDTSAASTRKKSIFGWEHARHLELSADFNRRAFSAKVDFDDSASAEPMAKALRVLLAAAATPERRRPAEGADAVAYLAQRATVGTASNSITVDSELSTDALEWLSAELAKRIRSHAKPS